MKAKALLYTAFAALTSFSCTREVEITDILSSEELMEFRAAWAEADSRTVLADNGEDILWTAGEEINIFYGSRYSGKFASSNTEPQAFTTFTGTLTMVTGSNESSRYWAVYPYNEANTCDGQSVILSLPDQQSGKSGSFADKFFPSVAVSATPDLAFYNVCGGARFSVTQEGIVKAVFKSNDGSPMAGKVKVGFGEDNKPQILEFTEPVDSVVVTAPEGGFAPGENYFAAVLPQAHAKGLNVTLYTAMRRVVKNLGNDITVKRSTFGMLDNLDEGLDLSNYVTPEMVDLGLSVKWASFNLGATKPEEYGYYFAWGETEPKEKYTWENYKFSDSGDSWTNVTLSKYNTYENRGPIDNKTVLDPEDDAVTENLGGGLRMATYAEWEELMTNCIWEWTTLNGVSGRKVTGNMSGYTDKWIFLPAAGLMYASPNSVGYGGYYWSSSLNHPPYNAYWVNLYSDYVGWYLDGNRCTGLSIRPVLDNPDYVRVTGITLNKTALSLYTGQNEQLVATLIPSNANNKTITWTSSNSSVATVDQNGKVTAVSSGNAVIRAISNAPAAISSACNVTVVAPVDLSLSGSANCYIVSEKGAYKYKTVKGNASTSVGAVAKAEVLWESFGTATAPSKGSIIAKVSYFSGYIIFETPSTIKNGNAVIAAKNASGNILWSWHIWVSSGFDPVSTAQTYYNNAGTMMDRNLGALSNQPGNVGALGLLYQWGRKDPFLGRASISSDTKALSTLSWPATVASTSSTGTITYTLTHPTTFIKENSKNSDWHYTGDYSTDNTRWKSSKTIYDPCPFGWRVPDGGHTGVWAKATKYYQDSYITYTYNSTNKGMNFSGKFGSAGTIWYPCAATLQGTDGELVGGYCFWWSTNELTLYIHSGGRVYPTHSMDKSDGLSVRCIKE